MGKSKDKKSRKRSPSPSSSEGKRKKRHRIREDEEGEKRIRKSEKRKDKKKSSGHRSEKKSKSKHKEKHRSKGHHVPSFRELSIDDYFSKNNEFSTWLKEEKKVFFSDLSSESAREMFSNFVKDWNDQNLDPRYYEGISSGPRTAHNWNFRN